MTTPEIPNHYKPGQSVRMTGRLKSDGRLVDPASIVFVLHAPDGTEQTFNTPSHDSLGNYHQDYVLPMNAPAGIWWYRVTSTGVPPAENGLGEKSFVVDALAF